MQGAGAGVVWRGVAWTALGRADRAERAPEDYGVRDAKCLPKGAARFEVCRLPSYRGLASAWPGPTASGSPGGRTLLPRIS